MFTVDSFLPKSELLKKHIEYYYFLSSEETNTSYKFIHYPHYRTALNIYFSAQVDLDKQHRQVSFDLEKKPMILLTHNFNDFKSAGLEGPINIIGVIFKPLGINYFLKQNLQEIITRPVMQLEDQWPNFSGGMKSVKEVDDKEQRIQYLDQLLLEQYQGFEVPVLEQMVQDILLSEDQVQVGQLALKYQISRRTILRLFRRHLNVSVEEFKRVVRFRKALELYQLDQEKPSLTKLAYLSNYYDQSDFISHFKSLAGQVPKKVLSELVRVGKQDLYWRL